MELECALRLFPNRNDDGNGKTAFSQVQDPLSKASKFTVHVF